ncbi:1-deoxy-D-xylulose-5-phosphate reductoisomerase, partial [Candidatus Peregrinibacteria bacterium]|nr:1-deoxy-D-xylulose-5-phosphate reductoisomerase [Candidatus Peregrinibacteria bacterium]
LMHEHGEDILSSVTLTCSGGPFLGKTTDELANVTIQQALDHPTWQMGPKVSLDSATLINKVLEVCEVSKLFNIPFSKIHISVHPQSLVHSMVHTKTGGTKMHITQNDMRLFISYALHYPNQPEPAWPILRAKRSEMNFLQADEETFRSIKWLKQHGGNPNFPIVLNALNDIATSRFLNGDMKFLEIYDFIEAGFEKWLYEMPPKTLEEMIEFHEKITNEHSNTASRGKVLASQAK